MKKVIESLSKYIGEASAVNRTDINKVFNRLVPEAKLERLLSSFGDGVVNETPFIWNDMLDAFTVALSGIVDVQGSLLGKARKRMRGTAMGRGEDMEMLGAVLSEMIVDSVLGDDTLEEGAGYDSKGVPKGGEQRARKRMDDAAKRGGIEKMIQATMTRIKATKDPGKMAGIVKAVDELIKQLERVKSAAKKAS